MSFYFCFSSAPSVSAFLVGISVSIVTINIYIIASGIKTNNKIVLLAVEYYINNQEREEKNLITYNIGMKEDI